MLKAVGFAGVSGGFFFFSFFGGLVRDGEGRGGEERRAEG